jgi:hypothetical protein
MIQRTYVIQVFVLAVSLTFKDLEQRDKWVAAWLPMVDQVGGCVRVCVCVFVCVWWWW